MISIFVCIHTSTADVATVNPNGIKTLLANNLSTFFVKSQPSFSNGARCLARNPPEFNQCNSAIF